MWQLILKIGHGLIGEFWCFWHSNVVRLNNIVWNIGEAHYCKIESRKNSNVFLAVRHFLETWRPTGPTIKARCKASTAQFLIVKHQWPSGKVGEVVPRRMAAKWWRWELVILKPKRNWWTSTAGTLPKLDQMGQMGAELLCSCIIVMISCCFILLGRKCQGDSSDKVRTWWVAPSWAPSNGWEEPSLLWTTACAWTAIFLWSLSAET